MKALAILFGLFLVTCGGGGIYLATHGRGQEYDLKFVLPIDTRQMPKPLQPPGVQGEVPASGSTRDARADSSAATTSSAAKPFKFEEGRSWTPELKASE